MDDRHDTNDTPDISTVRYAGQRSSALRALNWIARVLFITGSTLLCLGTNWQTGLGSSFLVMGLYVMLRTEFPDMG